MKKGTKHTAESKLKIKAKRKLQVNFGNEKKIGKHYSPRTEFKKGQATWNKDLDYKQIKRNRHWNWKGGVSLPDYKEKVAGRPKPKRCEVCTKSGRICFDHDHKTGKFRGWICHKCNATLGLLGDSPKLLKSLLKYLKSHE